MSEITDISVELLADHKPAIQTLSGWFEAEWPAYYGTGGQGSALYDLHAYANLGSLPVGVVALQAGAVCGIAVLKAESIASHKHLSPWVTAGLVHPSMRGRGIGCLLLGSLEEQARALGFNRIFCGTSTAERLLLRCGWQCMENIVHDGDSLGVFAKEL